MSRDDPIAQLRALDPADAKELETVLATLGPDALDRIVAQRAPARAPARPARRPRFALLAAGALGATFVVVALVANPFSRRGTISSAKAQAQVADALGLQGGWHVKSVWQGTEGAGSATPHYVPEYTDDAWHAPDGRLVITNTLPSGDSSTTLYARGERRSYDSTNTLRIHRFVNAADLRDEVRSLRPPSAADLYRAAYRIGKVRLAGIETIGGRRVYRLAFDWLGSNYTLVFDAHRRVPISSVSRSPSVPGRFFFTRVRYAAYEHVRPGPSLDRRLALPAVPRDAKIVQDRPIVVPAPVRDASAERLARALASSFDGVPGRHLELARATYAVVQDVPGGGVVAIARIPNRGRDRSCMATAEFAHPGGEARVTGSGCGDGGTGYSLSQTGRAMIVAGSTRRARAVELRFAGGASVQAGVRDGMFLATPPVELFRKQLTIVITNVDGSVDRRPLPQQFLGTRLPTWFTR
jgi:hypothetical protein